MNLPIAQLGKLRARSAAISSDSDTLSGTLFGKPNLECGQNEFFTFSRGKWNMDQMSGYDSSCANSWAVITAAFGQGNQPERDQDMKIMSGLFVVMATIATSTHAQIGSVLPLQDLSITGPSGHAIAQVSGLPALPHATFQTTPLAPSLSAEVEYDPKNSSAVFGPFYTFQLIPAPVNSGLDFGSVSTLQFLILRAHGGSDFIGLGT